MQILVQKRNYHWSFKPAKNKKKVIKQQQQKKQNWNVYQGMGYVTLDGKWMMKEDGLCNLRKRVFMRVYFNTEISIGENKVTLKVVKLPQ